MWSCQAINAGEASSQGHSQGNGGGENGWATRERQQGVLMNCISSVREKNKTDSGVLAQATRPTELPLTGIDWKEGFVLSCIVRV